MNLNPGFVPVAERISYFLLFFVEVENKFPFCDSHTIEDWEENDKKRISFELGQLMEVAANQGFTREVVFQEMEEMEAPLQLSLAPSLVARNFFWIWLTLTREPFC